MYIIWSDKIGTLKPYKLPWTSSDDLVFHLIWIKHKWMAAVIYLPFVRPLPWCVDSISVIKVIIVLARSVDSLLYLLCCYTSWFRVQQNLLIQMFFLVGRLYYCKSNMMTLSTSFVQWVLYTKGIFTQRSKIPSGSFLPLYSTVNVKMIMTLWQLTNIKGFFNHHEYKTEWIPAVE